MQCPARGGQSARARDTNHFECTSQVFAGEELVGVAPRNPYQPFEVPIYRPVYRYCGHVFTAHDAAAASARRLEQARQEREAARAQAAREQAREAEEVRRRAWEDERDAAILKELPTISAPPPGPRPYDSDPDAGWFLGFIPYSIGGTAVLWFILVTYMELPPQDAIAPAAIVASAAYLVVLGFWLIRAFRRRRSYAAAVKKHGAAVEAERRREVERARLRADRPYPG